MKLHIFLPEAESEMLEAAAFYEMQQPMLGKRFLAGVQDAITRIRINPLLYPFVALAIRRCLVRAFPYGIVFKMVDKRVVILSVMHMSRDPETWKERNSF